MWEDRREFKLPEVPLLHPLSSRYTDFWAGEMQKNIEGIWINGIWCPPQLYHYLNYATILVGEKKSRRKSLPWDLDYVWDLAYYWIEARGLSGFEKIGDVPDIRSFLRTRQNVHDLGKPLYNNEAQNLLVMGPRGWGKSYWGANCAAHEYLTDARKEYFRGEPVKEVAEILLSAYASPFVNDLIAKIQDILFNYPGGIEVNGEYYPPPFFKTLSGEWTIGKKVENWYKKKSGGKSRHFGTRSCFKPRVYRDRHQAGVGGRNTLKIGEEIGTWENLIESHFADENTQRLNNYKFGSTLYIGTGGDMVGGGTLASQKMFYDPEAYDCLVFDDTYEKRGKIGLFFPATYTKINYKDEQGNTNWKLADAGEEAERDKKKLAKDAQAYDEYVVYNPIVPSEIFLSRTNNIFPLKDLQYTLANIESTKLKDAEWVGDLVVEPEGTVSWKNNDRNKPLYEFPITSAISDYTGSVVIYEHPVVGESGEITWGRYIAGIDPYDHDKSNSGSLGSIVVIDNLTNRIVAEYSGRPETANDFYEICRRLIVYFNAVALYENEKKGVFTYFENCGALHLLARQPKLIRDVVQNSTVDRGYGLHMSEEIKRYGEGLINTWLRRQYEGDVKVCHKIRCIPLLKELILYNIDGNFDRVMALMLAMYQKEEMRKYVIDKQESIKGFLDHDFFKSGIKKQGPKKFML
jgi:hypothetical protein